MIAESIGQLGLGIVVTFVALEIGFVVPVMVFAEPALALISWSAVPGAATSARRPS